jgi:cell division transport system permease protein
VNLSFDFDFDFKGDKTNGIVPFIIGFLMYSVTIAAMSCFFTNSLTSEWSRSLNGRMTIEFQSNVDGVDENLTEKQKEDVIKVLRETPGIKSVKHLKESDILKVLEPWLSGTSIPDDFPFPAIFDVEVDESVRLDLLQLSEKLAKISHSVKIHDHAKWYAPIMKISNGLFTFAILLSILIFATVCATIVFITRKTLGMHENVVRILQLIGANNGYIAAQFKQHYLQICYKSSLLSFMFSLLTIMATTYVTSSVIFNVNSIGYLLISLAVTVISVGLIIITAQKSVLFFLNNDRWVA